MYIKIFKAKILEKAYLKINKSTYYLIVILVT